MHIYKTRLKQLAILLVTFSLLTTTVALPMSLPVVPTKNPTTAEPVTIVRGQATRPLEQIATVDKTRPLKDKQINSLKAVISLATPSSTPKSAVHNESQAIAHKILTKASKLLGIPYGFGGNDPQKALDCSSYVQLVFNQVGIELPRSTFGQIKMGKAVEYADLRPGDLVFFSSDGPGPTHVGIYIGNGKMINETPPKVEVDTIITPSGAKTFYGRTYYAARRILPE